MPLRRALHGPLFRKNFDSKLLTIIICFSIFIDQRHITTHSDQLAFICSLVHSFIYSTFSLYLLLSRHRAGAWGCKGVVVAIRLVKMQGILVDHCYSSLFRLLDIQTNPWLRHHTFFFFNFQIKKKRQISFQIHFAIFTSDFLKKKTGKIEAPMHLS